MKEYQPGKIVLKGLPHGADLTAAVLDLASEHNIKCASVNVIGAVTRAVIGYYQQTDRVYQELVLEEPLEIISCLGNISDKEGQNFFHGHIALGRPDGSLLGGHLCFGTLIFAGECLLRELVGEIPTRRYDPVTGLGLWADLP